MLAVIVGAIIALAVTLISLFIYKFPKITKGEGELEADVEESLKFVNKHKKLIEEVITGANTCLYLSDVKHTLDYERTQKVYKNLLHNGQLKLFLTELEFLTECLDSMKDKCIVIYAGSAPSNKIKCLADMFPGAKFVLVDPREHYIMYPKDTDMYDHPDDIIFFKTTRSGEYGTKEIQTYNNKRVKRSDFTNGNGDIPGNICEIIQNSKSTFHIIEDFYSDGISEILTPLTTNNRVLFISDIRSKNETEDNPTDLDIIWNSALMYNWIDALKPERFMVKFRTPYHVGKAAYEKTMKEYNTNEYVREAISKCKLKLLDNLKSGKFDYIKADHIYMQAFAGQTSTESRIIASSLDTQEYDCDDYNDKFFYYNRIQREYGYHTEHKKYLDKTIGIDHCGDCAIMCKVISAYYTKYNGEASPEKVKDTIRSVLKTIHRNIKSDKTVHGHYFEQNKTFKDFLKSFKNTLGKAQDMKEVKESDGNEKHKKTEKITE
jgi:hypothetical protein